MMQEHSPSNHRSKRMRSADGHEIRTRGNVVHEQPVAVQKSRLGRNARAELEALIKQSAVAARMLKSLGNERRLLTLCFLVARGEMTAGELVAVVGLGQSALSQHLARLRADGIVTYRRQSQTLYYRIADRRAARILAVLKDLYCRDMK
jgi:ArsR family transcriptional regulator, virulence genes transcriptional regulator